MTCRKNLGRVQPSSLPGCSVLIPMTFDPDEHRFSLANRQPRVPRSAENRNAGHCRLLGRHGMAKSCQDVGPRSITAAPNWRRCWRLNTADSNRECIRRERETPRVDSSEESETMSRHDTKFPQRRGLKSSEINERFASQSWSGIGGKSRAKIHFYHLGAWLTDRGSLGLCLHVHEQWPRDASFLDGSDWKLLSRSGDPVGRLQFAPKAGRQ
ncbi:UNVERIFIED_ORG: hypothetical protein GGD51_002076 [Rhizobium esperanzae]